MVGKVEFGHNYTIKSQSIACDYRIERRGDDKNIYRSVVGLMVEGTIGHHQHSALSTLPWLLRSYY